MRPVISGIGNEQHKLDRKLCKIQILHLGTISPSNIKDSGEPPKQVKKRRHKKKYIWLV